MVVGSSVAMTRAQAGNVCTTATVMENWQKKETFKICSFPTVMRFLAVTKISFSTRLMAPTFAVACSVLTVGPVLKTGLPEQ